MELWCELQDDAYLCEPRGSAPNRLHPGVSNRPKLDIDRTRGQQRGGGAGAKWGEMSCCRQTTRLRAEASRSQTAASRKRTGTGGSSWDRRWSGPLWIEPVRRAGVGDVGQAAASRGGRRSRRATRAATLPTDLNARPLKQNTGSRPHIGLILALCEWSSSPEPHSDVYRLVLV